MIPLGTIASAHVNSALPPITDSFNRAAGALGVTDTGQTWATTGTTAVNASNQAQLTATASASVTAATVSQTVSAKFVALTQYQALTARAAAFQMFLATAGGAITVRANGSDTATGSTAAAGDVLALTVKEVGGGTQVTAFKNGTQIYTVLDARGIRDVTSLTFGLSSFTYGGLFDDFKVEAA